MALLTTLQGNGGGRIPMDGFSYAASRRDLAAIINAMPTEHCRAMHIAARQGDLATAQRLLREAIALAAISTARTPPNSNRKLTVFRPGQTLSLPSVER